MKNHVVKPMFAIGMAIVGVLSLYGDLKRELNENRAATMQNATRVENYHDQATTRRDDQDAALKRIESGINDLLKRSDGR